MPLYVCVCAGWSLQIDSLKEHVAGLERLKEQSMEEVKHFRHTLETTVGVVYLSSGML